MISNIFITDPEKRFGIEEIRNHPWFKLHQPVSANFNAKRSFNNVNMNIV